MGYDIKIVPKIKDVPDWDQYNYSNRDDEYEKMYLSFNWSNLSYICPDHAPHTICSCEGVHLWYIRDDLNEKTGAEVANGCFRALMLLSSMKISQYADDSGMWKYLESKDYPDLTFSEKLCVFAKILKNFMMAGLRHHDRIFIIDQ